jgi:molecular chaperone DnaK
MNRIGVDLGTTNTVVCMDGRVLAIGDDGSCGLPSVVGFLPNGTVALGHDARRRRAIDGPNTIFSSKRIIGCRFSEDQTRAYQERYPFEIVDAGDDQPAFQTRHGLKTPTEIASLLLSKIGQPLQSLTSELEVVITVPTGFSEERRRATVSAAQQAGFEDLYLVDEAQAAALAYQADPDVTGVVAVYDLGGGTFDVSILDCQGLNMRVLAQASEPFLGGDDIDRKIADWVASEVLKQHNWDLSNYSEVDIRLLAECERAKIRLASSSETLVDLSLVDPECPLAGEGLLIRQRALDDLCLDLVRRTFQSCDEALDQAGLRAGDLRAVVLAGGTTHLPMIQQAVEAYFGRTGLIEFEPTEVVAIGAAIAGPDRALST